MKSLAAFCITVLIARANVVAKEATLRKVNNGARQQERDAAWSSVSEAKAVMENAQAELRRRQELFSAGVCGPRRRGACHTTEEDLLALSCKPPVGVKHLAGTNRWR